MFYKAIKHLLITRIYQTDWNFINIIGQEMKIIKQNKKIKMNDGALKILA